jgi:uncharacterized protein DUF6518
MSMGAVPTEIRRAAASPGPSAQASTFAVVALSVAGGLVLGALDLAAQKLLPYPWANLANSSAVWALGAFALGTRVGGEMWRAATAGVVLLIVAVETYYLSATLVQHDSLSNLSSATTQVWLVFAVVAGALFAVAGAWARSADGRRRVVGIAMSGSVLFAEALVLLRRASGRSGANRLDDLQTAAIEAVLGIGLIVLLARRPRGGLLRVLAACLPLSAIGFVAFLTVGFGSR